ncbi:hypothetical protein [Lysobacter silvisoli]|uniref:Uncharacterized protein n=1 Tax=Lysobacter silvisoli TaxID=2293254 RepID=A0A371K1L4_9GAMM|nr:hypothetical protein [Lysobacter silvisoli]RDZ27737.1 hypothetical protein DX914_00735 [Lysobacter silvisoli]
MKRVLLASLIAACAFAASAQTVSATADVSAQAGTDAQAKTSLQAEARADRAVDRNCLRHTGTHIRDRAAKDAQGGKDKKRCVAANGRVYTRGDIESTGETNINEALRRLDPSIR